MNSYGHSHLNAIQASLAAETSGNHAAISQRDTLGGVYTAAVPTEQRHVHFIQQNSAQKSFSRAWHEHVTYWNDVTASELQGIDMVSRHHFGTHLALAGQRAFEASPAVRVTARQGHRLVIQPVVRRGCVRKATKETDRSGLQVQCQSTSHSLRSSLTASSVSIILISMAWLTVPNDECLQ